MEKSEHHCKSRIGQLRPSYATRVHAGSESLIVGRDYVVSSYTSVQTGLRPDAEIHCALVRPLKSAGG